MMENKFFSVLSLRYLWLFLPALLVFLYGIQSVAGVLIYRSTAASQFVGVLILGLSVYVLTYLSLSKYFTALPWLERKAVACRLQGDVWIKLISAAYFILMIYALVSSEEIALWEAINGATSADIAQAREALFKARTGWEQSLGYLSALFSSALMPYVLVVCYLEKKPYRHILLSLFVISLLPSLEKALVIKAFLPLIVVAFSGYLPRRSGYLFIALMLCIILGTTQLTKMGQVDPNQQAVQFQESQLAAQDKAVAKYQILGSGSRELFLVNRVFWIPYITAYDWLGYFHEKMHDEYLYGSSSLVVSTMTGRHQYPIEKEVFIYQFGAGGPSTAAANTIFLVDAFVNFGWLGVMLCAALFAALTRLVELLDNPAAQACYYYFAYQVAVGGLFGVLFSNGMLILIALALFTKPTILPSTK